MLCDAMRWDGMRCDANAAECDGFNLWPHSYIPPAAACDGFNLWSRPDDRARARYPYRPQMTSIRGLTNDILRMYREHVDLGFRCRACGPSSPRCCTSARRCSGTCSRLEKTLFLRLYNLHVRVQARGHQQDHGEAEKGLLLQEGRRRQDARRQGGPRQEEDERGRG